MYVPRSERTLNRYLDEINRIPLVTPDAEAELARRIKLGDEDALLKLARANLRFVVTVARKYQGRGLHLIDLINEGNYGMMKAAQRFDETRGFKFISYAVWWIRQSILQALARDSRIVRMPLNRISAVNKIGKVSAGFVQSHERTPTADELAETLDLDLAKIMEALLYDVCQVSMDAPLQEADERSLFDVLNDKQSPSPDEDLMSRSMQQDLDRALHLLSRREREVVCLYYGLGVKRQKTLQQIGHRLGLTRERVRQIKEAALSRLREPQSREYLQMHV